MNRRNSTPSPRRTAACLLLAAAGILMFLPACDRAEREPSPPVLEPDVRGGDGLHESEEMARILELQLRRDGPGLAEALEDPAPEVRARAAFALASVQDEGARQALERRLDDPEPRVRRDVVFALGQLPLESSEPLLLELFRTEEDPGVRERVLEALGKGGGPEAARALVELEPEEDRLAAARALAISRRALALSTVADPNRELVTSLVRELLGLLQAEDPAVRLRAAHYFARTQLVGTWTGGIDQVREAVDDADPDDEVLAPLLQGLVRMDRLEDHHRFLRALTTSGDWRVRAVAAQALGTPRMLEVEGTRSALLEVTRTDPSYHVVQSAAVGLAEGPFAPRELVEEAAASLAAGTAQWRRQVPFVQLLGEMGREDEVLDWFDRLVDAGEPAAIVRAIQELQQIPSTAMGPAIMALADHEDDQVRAEVVSAVAENWFAWVATEEGISEVFQILAEAVHQGPGLAANRAARALAEPAFHSFGAVGELLEAEAARPASDVSGRTVLLRALGEAGDPLAEERLRDGLEEDDFRVRRAAARGLELLTGQAPAGLEIPAVERPVDPERLRAMGPRPRMVVETDGGEIVVVLAADEAPQTVTTLAEYIEAGHFDGVPFHRVIPNFVAQGGDVVFGDGSGTPGARLTSEFTQIPFVRGVVGMASSGKDTEGSQFFFTHSPQFHLDGAYTAFGWVESGEDAMDRIQPADRIVSVRWMPDPELGGR